MALLLKFHSEGVMNQKKISRTTKKTMSRQQKILEGMTKGAWESLVKSLGVKSYFGP